MKNIFKLFILSSVLLVSCDKDLLQPFTPGALTPDVAITTSSDLQQLMNSTYANFTNRQEFAFSSVFTDECGIGFANGGQETTGDYVFNINVTSNSPTLIWEVQYYTLSRANRVIDFAGKIIPTSPADAQLILRLKAEALTIRAFAHLKLLSYFSPDPKNNSSLAAVLADKIINSSDSPKQRSTNGEFYASIQGDLDNALAIYNGLTTTPYTGLAVTYYPNKNAVKALKARAYALKGDYPNAETWANDVITNSGISLATASNYNNVFFTDNEPSNTEVIFRLKRTPAQNTQASNLHNVWCSVKPTLTGSPFFEISRSLFNLVNSNPLDIRRTTLVSPSSVIDPGYATSTDYRNTDKLIINKHGGVAVGVLTAVSTAANSFNNDFKLIRLSEMYFIRAEARAAANDFPGVASNIKTILDNRYSTPQTLPVYTSASNAFKGILDQRRIEFAFEGYRFIDLKRLAVLAGTGIDRDPADYSSTSSNYPAGNPSNLQMSSYKWALPIPQSELNANPSIQQNPGY